jgi:LmbE family N-acetylglucosaminyl deacetylase
MQPKRLLAVWAHPDDEAFGPVGTMQLAHDRGWQTAVVTATRGDAGQRNLAQLAPDQTLGDLREQELRCSCALLGVTRLDVWRYADGGLRDVPADELIERIAAVLREWQPSVVLTFGPDGITGHPDHLTISAATKLACDRVRAERDDEPRLYYVTVSPERPVEHSMGAAPPALPPTAIVDVSAYEPIKRQALECHASQRDDWQPLLADQDWLTTDYFYRAFPPAADGAAPETTILHE